MDNMYRPPDRPGRVIPLNGASSSGNTSIAGQLLLLLDPQHFHMSLALDRTELPGVLARTRARFHRAVVGMAHAGNDSVADCVFSEPWRLPRPAARRGNPPACQADHRPGTRQA
jgi:chloramphenicol 3-O phosphotransferase